MLVIAVQFFVSKSEISELFLDDFYKGFYDFGTDADSTKFVNYVQTKFACCGSENSTDWDLNKVCTELVLLMHLFSSKFLSIFLQCYCSSPQ